MKTIHFNTQRLYTAQGQRISATLHEDGVITFYDHSREIHGEFSLYDTKFAQLDPCMVTTVYDSNFYVSTRRSWADRISTGCNGKWED